MNIPPTISRRLAIPCCLAGAAAALLGCGDSAGDGASRADIFVVRRGPLPIRVTEQAEILPAVSTRIKSEMEGQSTIIYLIQEGVVVEKGEKLVELDASGLVERKAQQEIAVHRADAERVGAREELDIRLKEFEAEKLGGENAVRIAEIDLEKYLGKLQPDGSRDMGEREQQLVEAQANIQLADAELKLAQNKLEWSLKLVQKGFITKDDVERDQLDVQRQEKNLRIARNELDILTKFTFPKELLSLEQAISKAKTDLEAIVKRGNARLAQAKADLEAKEKEYELELERLQNLVMQIQNSVIRAPTPGLVVYASQGGGHRGRQDFIEEGATVRERQVLIELPDVTRMIATLKVHEAAVDKVREGQRALIKVDTFSDREFVGYVRRVSPVADSGSTWTNNGLKVYKTEVEIEGENVDLKPNMSASVTIIVASLENVLFVPLQAVQRQGRVSFVWVNTPAGPVAKPVDVGLNDFQFVEIVNGLTDGAEVFLATPPNVLEPEFEQPVPIVTGGEAAPAAAQGGGAPAVPEHAEAALLSLPAAAANGDSSDAPGGGQVEPLDNGGEPAAGGAPTSGSAAAALEELLGRKYPALAKIVAQDRRAWFTNEELKQAVETDDELREARDAMRKEMRARFGERGERREGGGERGERRRRGPGRGDGGEDAKDG